MRPWTLFVALVFLVACRGGDGVPLADVKPLPGLDLRSADFQDGGPIPRELTCDRVGRSPALAWRNAVNADGYLLTVLDRDANDFVHWVVWRIGGQFDAFEAGSIPPGATEGTNDFGERGYGPPCPPEGDEPHTYVFDLYALGFTGTDPTAAVAPGSSIDDVLEAASCCLIGHDAITATFKRDE